MFEEGHMLCDQGPLYIVNDLGLQALEGEAEWPIER